MSRFSHRAVLAAIGLLVANLNATFAQESAPLEMLSPDVLTDEQRTAAKGMIDAEVRRRTTEFNAKHRADWQQVSTREQWEKYRDPRIAALKASLGKWPTPGKLNAKVTAVLKGDGYQIENTLFESRPGLWVAANVYAPATPTKSMPGILIAHAHHRGKNQSELQDMGMMWARAGCVTVVIDQFGYGERRTHPFHRDEDYPKPYRASRQDYYFRYDTGVQLQTLGDSLMGWMAWDLMRATDLLLAREGVDPQRILLLGAVAGGGDPAGVTAALDSRITCVVPFNFGGPQPETRYPLPDDAETSFNYLLFTYWESTRGLRLGGQHDFPHWVIVASIAPRHLIHSHEFAWDGARDPVWKRYQKVWGEFYSAADHVGVAHGKGSLRQSPPEASHCTNIGKFHRQMIHPLFEKWFDIKAPEFSAPRPADELLCVTDAAKKELNIRPVNDVLFAAGAARVTATRQRLAATPTGQRRATLRNDWAKILGPIVPSGAAKVLAQSTDATAVSGAKVERVTLEVESGIVVPLLLLLPEKMSSRSPVVVGLAQGGKVGFLKERGDELRKLIQAGVAIALPDLRGTGETRGGSSRGRDSGDTDRSVHLQVFGETVLGQRLRDLRSVVGYLRGRRELDAKRIALWGDSFAPVNTDATNFKVPHAVDGWPTFSEPMGGMLALLGGLFDEDVRAIHVSGGLTSYQSLLGHFAVLTPHDVCVPGALDAGDWADLAAAVSPRPLRLENMVDALNRRASSAAVRTSYAPTIAAYADRPQALSIAADKENTSLAKWLAESLK